ncbi:hypothetical protein [Collimonas humicola]|uniref:hypothetical protein n=1 Tax=Collimonas humicola TaxID=2825886 RepID=UPI001B8C855F|nr:hypothetical protein [Collimonas humicola]
MSGATEFEQGDNMYLCFSKGNEYFQMRICAAAQSFERTGAGGLDATGAVEAASCVLNTAVTNVHASAQNSGFAAMLLASVKARQSRPGYVRACGKP